MIMVCRCQVCKKDSRNFSNISFHSIPTNPETRGIWFSLLGLNPSQNLPKRPSVCSDHFEKTDFHYKSKSKSRKYLNREAVPKLYSSSGQNQSEVRPDFFENASTSKQGQEEFVENVERETHTEETITVKIEADDFDNRKTGNEVDQDLDQKSTIQILSHIKSEEEDDFINSQYWISHEEVHIKPEDDEEQSDSQFKNHQAKHKPKDEIIHKCPDCPYQSKRKGDVNKHSVRHKKPDEIVWHHCTECVYETPWKHNLTQHLRLHQEENIPWMYCPEPECPYKTLHKRNLKVHSLVHSNDQVFKCTQCSYQAKRQQSLKRHQLKHESTNKWHACPQCPFKTIHTCSLKDHVFGMHVNPDQLKWYRCEYCSYKTNRKYSLKQHAFTHDMDHDKWLHCTSCSFKTWRKSDLKQHQTRHQEDDGPGWHKCPECPYKAVYKHSLQRHAKNHKAAGQTDWLQCPECSYRTPRPQQLKAHQMLHTSVAEWFHCFDCPYKTNWKTSLVRHVPMHRQTGREKLTLYT